jgi:hydroxyacylglutathione hydrolase
MPRLPVMTESLRDLLQLHVVADSLYDQNCYLLRRRDTDACLIVDPGLQTPSVLAIAEREALRCERILLTHGHPDHVNGVPAVKAAHGCPAAISAADRWLLDLEMRLPGIPDDLPPVVCEDDLDDGQVVRWQDLDIAVLHTPGHTPGSVCFLVGPDLIAGDTLFRRGVGRADLPGGDWEALCFSIEQKLYTLPPDTVVHPGHGESTTVGEEMAGNPFVVHPRFR